MIQWVLNIQIFMKSNSILLFYVVDSLHICDGSFESEGSLLLLINIFNTSPSTFFVTYTFRYPIVMVLDIFHRFSTASESLYTCLCIIYNNKLFHYFDNFLGMSCENFTLKTSYVVDFGIPCFCITRDCGIFPNDLIQVNTKTNFV